MGCGLSTKPRKILQIAIIFSDLCMILLNQKFFFLPNIVGLLPKTKRGNTHIIFATEYLTKWPEARAIPNAKDSIETGIPRTQNAKSTPG